MRLVGRHAPRPGVDLREQRDAAPRPCGQSAGIAGRSRPDDRARRAQRALGEGELARGPEADGGERGGRGDGAAGARARARWPPPIELPATCGRSSPCSANQRSRCVVKPSGLGSTGSAAEPAKPGRSTAMTRRSRASAPTTGSHMPRWLPMPCRSTSGGPEPWLSKASAMAGQPTGGRPRRRGARACRGGWRGRASLLTERGPGGGAESCALRAFRNTLAAGTSVFPVYG